MRLQPVVGNPMIFCGYPVNHSTDINKNRMHIHQVADVIDTHRSECFMCDSNDNNIHFFIKCRKRTKTLSTKRTLIVALYMYQQNNIPKIKMNAPMGAQTINVSIFFVELQSPCYFAQPHHPGQWQLLC